MRALAVVSLVVLSACGGLIGVEGGGGGAGGLPDGGRGGGAATGGGSGGGGGATASGELPCDVAALLAARCASCHGTPLAGGAPVRLLSRADLLAASAVNPAETYGARSVVRMRQTASPMPPGTPPPTAEVDAFAAWVSAGMMPGSCGSVDAGSTEPTCASNQFTLRPVFGDEHGGPDMAPGLACHACHSGQDFMGQNPGGRLSRPDVLNQFMGTVFTAPHEKDLCRPALPVAASIEILDVGGTVRATLSVNAGGNFFGDAPSVVSPYRARVVTAAGSREMATPQTNGDCNTCHTVAGANGAQGRIYLP